MEGATQEEREEVRMLGTWGRLAITGQDDGGRKWGARTWGWLPGRGNRGLQDPP